MTTSFSKKEAIVVGWERFKERPWFLVALFVVSGAISAIFSFLAENFDASFTIGTIDFLVQAFVSVAMLYAFFAVYDEKDISFSDLFTSARFILRYIILAIVSALCIILGFVFFIVPGIIIGIALSLSMYVLIDQNTPALAALRESWSITKGHRLNLLVFFIMLGVLNILGVLALGVGVLVTAPVSALAMVHVYRELDKGVVNGVEVSPFVNALAVFAIGAVAVLGVSVILATGAFSIDPKAVTRDAARYGDMAEISFLLEAHKDEYGTFPNTITELYDTISETVPVDPLTGAYYEYTASPETHSFELCARMESTPNTRECVYEEI